MLAITTLHPHPPKTCSTFTVSAPPSCVSAVYPLNKSSSRCRLSEFLPFASAVHSQLAQLSSLSLAKQPICKDRGRVKERNREKGKGEENQRMEMRRKGGERQIALIMQIVRSCILCKPMCTEQKSQS